MRNILLVIQSVFVCLFLAAFITSFFVMDSILERSRVAVTDRVVAGTSSKIDFAEELMNSKAASRYLAKYQLDTMREEISSFKQDPYTYVESVTLDDKASSVMPPTIESKNPLKRALMEKVFSWKIGLKGYFDNTFAGLVIDLRIFLVSNIVGLFLAIFICIKPQVLGKRSMPVSTILTTVIALSSLSYVDQHWLFSILLNSYAGYSYPLGILIATAWIYYKSTRTAA